MTNRILLALSMLLFCSGIAHSQCTTINLYGALIIPMRDHPEKFIVFLKTRMGEQEMAHSYVDLNGRFAFEGIADGSYDVVVHIDGFKELRERVDIIGSQGMKSENGVLVCSQHEVYWLTPNDATTVVDESRRGYPKAAVDEYVLAVAADTAKRYKEVVVHLENVVRLAPDWFDAHCELGVAYEEVDRKDDAEKEYRKALELKPNGFRALMSLGRLLLLEADEKLQSAATRDAAPALLNQAREVLANAAAQDPMAAMAAYLLGAVHFRLASYKDAETELKRALALDASIFPARVTLINVYIDQRRWQNALDNVDSFIIENPNSVYRQQILAIRSNILRHLSPAQ